MQADDGKPGQRLAGAGFADDAEHFAGRDFEATRSSSAIKQARAASRKRR